MDQKIRILIADDQPKVRLGLRLLLEREEQIEILGEVADAVELLDLLIGICPDLVLLDWGLASIVGVELFDYIKGICPMTNIFVLSGRPEVEFLAIEAGAIAFFSKADPPEQLLQTLFSLCPQKISE